MPTGSQNRDDMTVAVMAASRPQTTADNGLGELVKEEREKGVVVQSKSE